MIFLTIWNLDIIGRMVWMRILYQPASFHELLWPYWGFSDSSCSTAIKLIRAVISLHVESEPSNFDSISVFAVFDCTALVYRVFAFLSSLLSPHNTLWDDFTEDDEEPKEPKTVHSKPPPQPPPKWPYCKAPCTVFAVLGPDWQVPSSRPSTPKHSSLCEATRDSLESYKRLGSLTYL